MRLPFQYQLRPQPIIPLTPKHRKKRHRLQGHQPHEPRLPEHRSPMLPLPERQSLMLPSPRHQPPEHQLPRPQSPTLPSPRRHITRQTCSAQSPVIRLKTQPLQSLPRNTPAGINPQLRRIPMPRQLARRASKHAAPAPIVVTMPIRPRPLKPRPRQLKAAENTPVPTVTAVAGLPATTTRVGIKAR